MFKIEGAVYENLYKFLYQQWKDFEYTKFYNGDDINAIATH